MRAITPLELLTSIVYGYLGLALPWNSLFSVTQGLHFATVFLAALTIGIAAWRRARWVPKATLVLAAWVGIPTFATAAGVVRVLRTAAGSPVKLSFGMVVLAACCQLGALVIALRHLAFREPAP